MPAVRFSRDKRGYEYVYLVHTPVRRGKQGKTRVLYWYRTPPGVRIGRQPFDPDVQQLIEQQNPGLTFDWDTIVNTPMPPPDMTEYWRERRRMEKAARQERRAAEAEEAPEVAAGPEPDDDGAPDDDNGGVEPSAQTSEVAVGGSAEGVPAEGKAPEDGADGAAAGPRKRRRRRGGRRRRPDGSADAGAAGSPDTEGGDEGADADGAESGPSEGGDRTSEEE